MVRKLAVDPNKAYALWVKLGQNYSRVAEHYKCSHMTIRRIALEHRWHERFNRDIEKSSDAIVRTAQLLAVENYPLAMQTLSNAMKAEDSSWRDKILAAKTMVDLLPTSPENRGQLAQVLVQRMQVNNIHQLSREELLRLAQGNLDTNVIEAQTSRKKG